MGIKKGPDIQDFVVETIEKTKTKERVDYMYFMKRADARDYVKKNLVEGLRMRVFHIKYEMVSDSKAKRKAK